MSKNGSKAIFCLFELVWQAFSGILGLPAAAFCISGLAAHFSLFQKQFYNSSWNLLMAIIGRNTLFERFLQFRYPAGSPSTVYNYSTRGSIYRSLYTILFFSFSFNSPIDAQSTFSVSTLPHQSFAPNEH
jgi:hypothetical protein